MSRSTPPPRRPHTPKGACCGGLFQGGRRLRLDGDLRAAHCLRQALTCPAGPDLPTARPLPRDSLCPSPAPRAHQAAPGCHSRQALAGWAKARRKPAQASGRQPGRPEGERASASLGILPSPGSGRRGLAGRIRRGGVVVVPVAGSERKGAGLRVSLPPGPLVSGPGRGRRGRGSPGREAVGAGGAPASPPRPEEPDY